MDGFTKTSEYTEERDVDFTSHSEYSYPTQTEPSLHAEELPVNKADITTTSTTSSDKTQVNFAHPDVSCLEVCLPPPLPANLNGCGIFNNYLFRQDPTTGRLSLVPVQVRAPESLLGLDINLSLVPQPLQRLISAPENAERPFTNCQNVPVGPEAQENDPPSYFSSSSMTLEHSVPTAHNKQTNPGTQGENQSPPESLPTKVHPALQEVIDLLKGEFSLNGDLDNGNQDISMGMYQDQDSVLFLLNLLHLHSNSEKAALPLHQ